jgi:hypothetical protein
MCNADRAALLLASVLLLTTSVAGSCQPEPVTMTDPITLTLDACAGYKVRLMRQDGTPTLTMMVARPDGSVPSLIFERIGSSWTLQASPGLEISGSLGAVDCARGVRLLGDPEGEMCLASLVSDGVCISP